MINHNTICESWRSVGVESSFLSCGSFQGADVCSAFQRRCFRGLQSSLTNKGKLIMLYSPSVLYPITYSNNNNNNELKLIWMSQSETETSCLRFLVISSIYLRLCLYTCKIFLPSAYMANLWLYSLIYQNISGKLRRKFHTPLPVDPESKPRSWDMLYVLRVITVTFLKCNSFRRKSDGNAQHDLKRQRFGSSHPYGPPAKTGTYSPVARGEQGQTGGFVREVCSLIHSPMRHVVTPTPQCSMPFLREESSQNSLPSHVIKDKVYFDSHCLFFFFLQAILCDLIKSTELMFQLSQQILDLFHACEQKSEDLEKKEFCRARLQTDIQRLFPCRSASSLHPLCSAAL